MAIKHKKKNPGNFGQPQQAVQRVVRPNKSHKMIQDLKRASGETVSIQNPMAVMMENAAKHIEWLELLVTGIKGRERNTIVKLTRREKTLMKMVDNRDRKIAEHKSKVAYIKNEHKEEIQGLNGCHKDEVKWLKQCKIDTHLPGLRDAIERDFIKKMQTSKITDEDRSAAKMLASQLDYERYGKGGWQQVRSNSATDSY